MYIKLPNSIKIIIFLLLLFICSQDANAAPKDLPYFASIKTDEANIRSGPSARYPIVWTYKRNNWPVTVTATFERWRKISDIYGEIGWIHEALLSNRRYVTIKGEGVQEAYRLPLDNSAKTFIIETGAVAELKECNKTNWCKVRAEKHDGWIKADYLWGAS